MWSPAKESDCKPAAARRLLPQDRSNAAHKKQDAADAADADMDGWISDDNLRALDVDVSFNQDIDWVAHDDVDLSLGLDFAPHADDMDVDSFGFGASPFLSPLRGDLPDIASIVEPVASPQKDAEKLLMSFDTMRSFSIPSPTSASSRKKRAGLFGRASQDGADSDSAVPQTQTGGSSLSVTVPAVAGEELRREHVRAGNISGLSITAPDAFLGAFGSSSMLSSSALPERKIGSYSPQARKLRIQKFHEKRKNRTWKKSIKYDCRKKLADDRPRIKGRFVRVLENGDDKDEAPSTPTESSSPKVLSGFPSPKSPSSAPSAPPDASEVCSVMPASPTPSSPTSVGMSTPPALSSSAVAIPPAIASAS